MKIQFLSALCVSAMLYGCAGSKPGPAASGANTMDVSIDLVNVQSDRVRVTVTPPAQSEETATYNFPKIIPGTYAIADYGRYISNIEAFDKKGKPLRITRTDSNTVSITPGRKLARLSYLVDDTFDTEKESDTFSETGNTIFSPAGTNIDAGKHFLLNMAGFVGYFSGQTETPYRITVNHPETLYGTTALVDSDDDARRDVFTLARYPDVIDNPVMYAAPDTSAFKVDGMEVLIGVYSPRGNVRASALRPDVEKMMRAQKKFLGKINDTPKYAVLTYISSGAANDAKGIGALEHNASTTAVFRDPMKSKDLIHVISHEFFHTLAPLKVHSKEIHYFDFNNPKMSQHLWFYEGVTEYFSNLFQVNQGLIGADVFYDLMAKKVANSRDYQDDLSFTEMSRNVLDPKIKPQYPNVYEKGALIAMCLDIVIREQSKGQRGLLWLMGELSAKFGPQKPFDDAELIPVITQIAGPEAGAFLDKHVVAGEPIVYEDFLAKVGLKKEPVPFPEPVVFMRDSVIYIKPDPSRTHVLADMPDDANQFYKALGIQNNDVFLEFNGVPIDPTNLSSIVFLGYDLDEGSPITVKVKRNGQDLELKGAVKLNYADGDGFRFRDESKQSLNQAWLKN
ncbi:M61 family metallopeptidase [Dyadobacter fermentans]|uniref:Peptidase M61 domain protein n=1 Tax=Dyadobacter fermentans (strain ATCC 700827 / DSM 18053 / CIP 107007 / KCTC 52180 / NS114) TaxID=471854 RepID=C6VSI1_DYAFD|nr:peptidase M61 [Dyadobacter fermentans]ACT92803.1 peptidase M61 domain protein [Dyadobacter fermentans DSM 18053]